MRRGRPRKVNSEKQLTVRMDTWTRETIERLKADWRCTAGEVVRRTVGMASSRCQQQLAYYGKVLGWTGKRRSRACGEKMGRLAVFRPWRHLFAGSQAGTRPGTLGTGDQPHGY
jgi:hypothetical protein